MNHRELEIPADMEYLDQVMNLLESSLEEAEVEPQTAMKICVSAEEIFTNIASYAYDAEDGTAKVCCDISDDNSEVTVSFLDQGKQYNPLAKPDPDITLSVEERPIGGLGVYMTKKMMDDVSYEYRDGNNILIFKKKV